MGKLKVLDEDQLRDTPKDRDFDSWLSKRQTTFKQENELKTASLNSQSDSISSNIVPCIDSQKSTISNVSIFGTVSSQKVRLLVDTGAAISVVSEQFYKNTLRPSFLLQQNTVDNIKTADGNITPVIGLVSFDVTIGKHLYNYNASVVPNLAYDIVLGRDFLHAYAAVIDVKGQNVTFDPQNIIAFAGSYRTPTVSDVRTAKTYVIESHSEVIIQAYLAKPIDPVVGLIEANMKLVENYNLMAAATLSVPDTDYCVTFRLINPSDAPVLLHKGTSIGTFCELATDDSITELKHDPVVSSVENVTTFDSNNVTAMFKCLPSPNLTTSENNRLNSILGQFTDIFAPSSVDLGRTTVIRHHIDTGDARPIKQPPYRVSHSQKNEIESQIGTMLDQGIIKVSSSPWSSPIVLVKKKDGTTRFCVDYRKLNAVTRKDSYPLPRIDDALDALAGAKYFTTLDLQSGYHQVAMDSDSIEKTAFISHAGLYEYNVMSFGLTNAPPTFQRLMQRVLHGLDWQICLVYIDEVIVFSSSFEEHLSRLTTVFGRLREANLKLKPSKCHFARTSVDFLGFVVSSEGILPDPSKLDTVRTFPVPKFVKDVRSFLGLCNYYRRFVKDFAKIASPLNRLTRKLVPFVWDETCEKAFEDL